MSDSYYAAEALPLIHGEPALVLNQYVHIILRLGNRFRKAHRQTTKLLLEKRVITFDTIHGLFGQWDVEYGLVSRPKSDIVCRMNAERPMAYAARETYRVRFQTAAGGLHGAAKIGTGRSGEEDQGTNTRP
ncbi:MAG: hypothetical protein ACOX9E_04350 [Lentisphaeria bacterium]|jgi:hypothetical protein